VGQNADTFKIVQCQHTEKAQLNQSSLDFISTFISLFHLKPQRSNLNQSWWSCYIWAGVVVHLRTNYENVF